MKIRKNLLRKFTQKNREYWNQKEIPLKKTSKSIYVMHIDCTRMDLVIPTNVLAKGIQSRYKLPVISMALSDESEVQDIADSFGFNHKAISDVKVGFWIRIMLWLYTLVILWRGTGRSLVKTTYKGVPVGDAIYDWVQGNRINRGIFNVDKLSVKGDAGNIYDCLLVAEQTIQMMKKNPPVVMVIHEITVKRGIPAIVALSMGSDIILNDITFSGKFPVIKHGGNIRESYKILNAYADVVKRNINNYTMKEKRDESIWYMDFGEEETFAREEVMKKIGIKNEKKNVFILPHAIGDSVRLVSTRRYYLDYNEWLCDTLSYIRNVKDVNWILKDHPCSKFYGQEKYIQDLFKKYQDDNIYWLDNNVNGDTVKNLADAIVTDCGDAGAEYVALGIPSISCGNTVYGRCGISYNAHSKQEYYALLSNVGRLEPPDEKQIWKAKKLMAFYKEYARISSTDKFLALNQQYYIEYQHRIVSANGYVCDNNQYIEQVLDVFEDFEDSVYMKFGYQFRDL